MFDEVSFEPQSALRGPTSIGCDQYTSFMSNRGGNNQGVGQLEFLAMTSSQSRRHNGGFTIKVDHDERETLEEIVNHRDHTSCRRVLVVDH